MSEIKLIEDVDIIQHLFNHERINFFKKSFYLKLSQEKVANLLYSAYKTIVEGRGKAFVLTEEIEKNILLTSEILTNPHLSYNGILLTGTVGNGKTTLLHSIREVIFYLYDQSIRNFPKNVSFSCGVPLFHARNLLSKESEYVSRMADILVIDDFGEEPTTVSEYGNIFTPLIDLLEYRYKRDKYTLISTNLTGGKIEEKYGVRISDRLEEMMYVIEFTGLSFRGSEL